MFLFFVTSAGDTRNQQQEFPKQTIFNHMKAQKTLQDKNLVQASGVIYRICIHVRSIIKCSCRYFLYCGSNNGHASIIQSLI